MNKLILTLFFAAVALQMCNCNPAELEADDALEFLNEKRELEAFRRFMYTGKEQRREAKENYEEKCERNVINKALNKDRWCPELETWPLWVQATKDDGAPSKKIIG